MPVMSSSVRPSGILTKLNVGGPYVILTPTTASEMMGKSVPHNTENARPMSSRLLNRKLASRLTIDSSVASACSSGSRVTYSTAVAAVAATRKKRK